MAVIGAAWGGSVEGRIDPEGIIRPCLPGTPEQARAKEALAAVDAQIRQLVPAAEPSRVAARLEKLSHSRCFKVVGELRLDAKSGLSLRRWWEDGGHQYFASALELGEERAVVWVPPDVRRAITLETAPAHRLRPLLCGAHDDGCGRETDGWRQRARRAIEQGARIRRLRAAFTLDAEVPSSTTDCETTARMEKPRLRFERYRQCLEAAALRMADFPIGRLKKPTEGWLVLSGRRGHYGFCDELRAFDLGSGTAYSAASCSDLSLLPGGSVDHRATDARRKVAVSRGTVSLEAIREAVWMLLLLREMDDDVLSVGFGQALPADIVVRLVSSGTERRIGLGGFGAVSSANTRLDWKVTTGTGDLGSGVLTWPRDLSDDAAAHAAELVQVAEASFVAGCPKVAPPPGLDKQIEQLSANHRDTDKVSLKATASALKTAWAHLLSDTCR